MVFTGTWLKIIHYNVTNEVSRNKSPLQRENNPSIDLTISTINRLDPKRGTGTVGYSVPERKNSRTNGRGLDHD